MMKFSRLNEVARAYMMSIAFWFGISLLMGWQYRLLNPQNLWPSFVDLLVVAGARAFSLAVWTPPIFYLVGKYVSRSKSRIRYVLLCGLGVAPFVLLQTGILWALVPPYDDVQQKYVSRSVHSWFEMIRTGFADEIFVYIAIVVAAHTYEYLKRLRRQERERYEYQQALAASELQALKMQLHPHFLFNTLHGIATLVDSDPKNSKAMIIKLSSLLRAALDRDSTDLISLQDELKFVGEYLDLEKMRFGSRLTIEWLVASDALGLLVPQMILQTLVENAVRHGVASSRDQGWVAVVANQEDGILHIQVRNSVGSNTSNGTGVGLRNAEARLKYLYSGEASLHLTIAEDRTATVSLTLPALNTRMVSLEEPHARNGPEGKDALCAFWSSTTSL
jgi:two-component system LytT family sensor kinase